MRTGHGCPPKEEEELKTQVKSINLTEEQMKNALD